MTISLHEIALYALGMAGLWAVPGPVWVALIARALSGGFSAAWPLAVGVALGDMIWPLAAILGLSWIEGSYGDALSILRYLAALIFIAMGVMLICSALPVGANALLFTQRYRVAQDEVVASIAMSTLTGLVTLPILLALLAAAVLQ